MSKRRCILNRRSHLDIKRIKIITKPEDIKIGIETEFGVKLVEHKECFDVWFLVKFLSGIEQM